MSKKLVAYFSASGITAKVAEDLADAIGADIFEIRPEVPYTKADLNWMDKKSRSTIEMSDPTSRPAIAAKRDNMDEYDNSPEGNFEALWQTIDRQYCFLDYKKQEYGLDWNEIYSQYLQVFCQPELVMQCIIPIDHTCHFITCFCFILCQGQIGLEQTLNRHVAIHQFGHAHTFTQDTNFGSGIFHR